ncbi:toxin-antitoxin system YwqK family antitoxin [Helicobacter jaachi]|uniref:Toxin-antitoxin system YwqK family antitoxin n=1 Tax=Helicobacter jaachi TaxID=1677920 RepID=A0A4U8TBK9_9HELI|nr:toxin-antitoxin system YwqK family antitoxin [Helicobacter jaachi]TLD97289.1 toxin-antitoxin system YwqK family antitoxin [Helicobacter jaachi]
MKYFYIFLLCVGVFGADKTQAKSMEYDLRISYTGDKKAPITIKTHYCKGTTMKCGTQTKTTSAGIVIFKARYVDDKYDGAVKSYYPNGKIREERTYNVGKEEGKRVLYYPNGTIQAQQDYKLNKREGVGKKFYENGALKMQVNYKDDMRDGVQQEFSKQNILMYETFYKAGRKQWLKHYDAQGKVIKEQNCRYEACY